MIVSPWYPVPPTGYGGIELMAYLLATELQGRGHDVTVIGQEGSAGAFESVAMAPTSWSSELGTTTQDARNHLFVFRAYAFLDRRTFDLVHDHTGLPGMVPAAIRRVDAPVVATVHGPIREAEADFLKAVDHRISLVAVSRSQRAQAPRVNWQRVVYNAVDPNEYGPTVERSDKSEYLLQLARICPDKGQHLAIAVAKRLGVPLVLAGKVDAVDRDYFKREIAPHLGNGVTWYENIFGNQKRQLLRHARAMLFPIQWEEPFGLAMVEAMVSGTPVIATPRGAASEIVEPGLTGWLASDLDGLVDAYSRLGEIDPERCAQRARLRFGIDQMADSYEAVYAAAIKGHFDGTEAGDPYTGHLAAAG